LALPADSLIQAERIAQARRVNLSTVISEALSEGLRTHAAMERSEQVLNDYKKAFRGFSDDEVSILDGVLLEPVDGPRGSPTSDIPGECGRLTVRSEWSPAKSWRSCQTLRRRRAGPTNWPSPHKSD